MQIVILFFILILNILTFEFFYRQNKDKLRRLINTFPGNTLPVNMASGNAWQGEGSVIITGVSAGSIEVYQTNSADMTVSFSTPYNILLVSTTTHGIG